MGMSKPALPELLTTAEVAEVFRKHPATIRRWVRDGELLPTKVPGRGARFRREDVERMLKAAS